LIARKGTVGIKLDNKT